MDHSTPVTEKLCQEVVRDMFDVILEPDAVPCKPPGGEEIAATKEETREKNEEGALQSTSSKATHEVGARVGGWELIHKAKQPPTLSSFTCDLKLEGHKVEC